MKTLLVGEKELYPCPVELDALGPEAWIAKEMRINLPEVATTRLQKLGLRWDATLNLNKPALTSTAWDSEFASAVADLSMCEADVFILMGQRVCEA